MQAGDQKLMINLEWPYCKVIKLDKVNIVHSYRAVMKKMFSFWLLVAIFLGFETQQTVRD